MLKNSLLLLAIFSACTAGAQANKSNGLQQRLIAEAYHTGDDPSVFILGDSVSLSYTGTGSSQFNYALEDYINMNLKTHYQTDFVFQASPQSNNLDSVSYPCISFSKLRYFHRDETNHLLYEAQQETDVYRPDGSRAHINTMFYDTLNNLDADISQILTYDSGRLSRVYVTSAAGTFIDTFDIRFFEYDNSGILVNDSMVHRLGTYLPWQPYWVKRYQHNRSGQYIRREYIQYDYYTGALYDRRSSANYTYYPDGRVQSNRRDFFDPSIMSNWIQVSVDSFEYTPGITVPTSQKFTRLDTIYAFPTPNEISYTRFSSPSQPDTISSLTLLNGIETLWSFHVFKYNGFGNPVTRHNYSRVMSSDPIIHRGITYYYYEQFDPAEVRPLQEKHIDIVIYPNPTKGRISLSYPKAVSGQRLYFDITNIQGQMVQSASFIAGKNSQELILGDEAAAGTYLIVIRDEKGGVIGRQKLAKE